MPFQPSALRSFPFWETRSPQSYAVYASTFAASTHRLKPMGLRRHFFQSGHSITYRLFLFFIFSNPIECGHQSSPVVSLHLQDARLVNMAELKKGMQLNASLMKSLTGGDKLVP